MKDGKPCRVCVDFKTWSKLEKTKIKTEKTSNVKEQEGEKSNAEARPIDNKPQKVTEEWKQNNCPADVETLGRHTWTLLHTMAAYYPERPSPSQQESMKMFMKTFSENYPCWFCKVSS